jgi:hypothetical protein
MKLGIDKKYFYNVLQSYYFVKEYFLVWGTIATVSFPTRPFVKLVITRGPSVPVYWGLCNGTLYFRSQYSIHRNISLPTFCWNMPPSYFALRVLVADDVNLDHVGSVITSRRKLSKLHHCEYDKKLVFSGYLVGWLTVHLSITLVTSPI